MKLITIATADYKKMVEDFLIPSVKNLEKEVELIIFSDGMDGYDGKTMDGISRITVRHICDLPYPLIALIKYHLLFDYFEHEQTPEDEEFMFVDANSKFLKKCPIENIDGLYFALSPYLFEPDSENKGIIDWNRPNTPSTRITGDYIYIQTSFFMGKVADFKKLYHAVDKLMKHDLNKDINERRLPNYSDESYAIKLINDDKESLGKFSIDKFVSDDYLTPGHKKEELYSRFPTIFINQKMRVSGKRNNPN